MDLKVEKKSFFDYILLFITLFANCEILYNHTGVSGYYSIYVSFILFITGFIYLILKNNGNIKISIIAIFCIIPIVIYNFCTESIRYGIFFLTLLTWSNIKFKNLKGFHKSIVILAVIFCLIQKVSKLERISGFMISPTIFSCVLVISLIYFLFEKDFEKVSLYDSLEEKKINIKRAVRTFEVQKANKKIATLLTVTKNDPVFYFETIAYSDKNIPMEFSKCFYRGDKNKFIVEIEKN